MTLLKALIRPGSTLRYHDPRPSLDVRRALLLLAAVSACLGSSPQSGSAAPTTTEPTGEVLTVSTANQTRAAGAPNASKARFEGRSADRQDEFASDLGGAVRGPTAWGPGTAVGYLRYEGTWYFATVVLEN